MINEGTSALETYPVLWYQIIYNRWEYDPMEVMLCIRMPTLIHKSPLAPISDATKCKLENITQCAGPAAEFPPTYQAYPSERIWLREFDPDDSVF